MADGRATPPVIDLAALAAPIPGDKPTGVDLRADDSPTSPYYELRGLRRQVSALERQADQQGGGEPGKPPSEWSDLSEKCQAALKEKTKDIEIVAWLSEALLRQHGLAGLRDGVTLAAELVEKHWDDLYSQHDEDDDSPEIKAQPFASLNGDGESVGSLIRPIRLVTITPSAGDAGPLAFWNCEQLQKGKEGLGAAEAAARTGGRPFYQKLYADLRGAIEAWRRLGKAFAAKLDGREPSSSQVGELLEAIERMLKLIAPTMIEAPAEVAAADAAATSAGGTGGATAVADSNMARPGTFATREQALEMLQHVAKYFREREPQSPVSYALDATVDRARMSLPELLEELLPDYESRKKMLQVAGIRPPDPPPDAKAAKN